MVCIIGDFNVQLDQTAGPRDNGLNPSRNSSIIMRMMDDLDLVAGDMVASATGPTYTFMKDGHGKSYIDHCFVSRLLEDHVRSCGVIPEHYMNTSDHLPIFISLSMVKEYPW